MKTPDEIKKALECCFQNSEQCGDCPYYPVSCDRELVRDAREYIRQLEAENRQYHQETTEMYAEMCMLREKVHRLEAQRDAAVKDLAGAFACFACERFYRNGGECDGGSRCYMSCFEWRVVQKEE